MSADTDRDRLLRLATMIADGARIDWQEAAVATEVDQVRALRWLAGYARGVDSAPEPVDAAAAGSRWGHLTVLEVIGRGSFGVVHRAYDTVLQREVALKLRHPQAPDAGGFAAIEEARRLARVRHPNVIAVHGADIHDGRIGIWTDLIPGTTLETMLGESGPFSCAKLLPLAEDLAAALVAVHAAGLVHGDIKAGNVMLDREDRIVLMDFGAGGESAAQDLDLLGSPLSMAPERFAAAALAPAADVYALAALWFRLLSGRHPVEAKDLAELRRRHLQQQAPAWTHLPPMPRLLRRLLAQMLAADPARRPSAGQVVRALAALREAPRRRRRRLAWAAVTGALAIGLVAVSLGYRHALLSERLALAARSDAEAVSSFLADILSSPRPTDSGSRTLMIEVLDVAQAELAQRFEGHPELAITVAAVLAESQASLGRHAEALALLDVVLETQAARGPADDGQRLRAAIAAARSETELGRHDAAEARLAALVVPIVRGADLALAVALADARGMLAFRRGEFVAAQAHFERAWELAQSTLNAANTEYRSARQHLGIVLLLEGRLDEGEQLLTVALADSRARFGERHADTLDLRRVLTYLYAERGEFDQAYEHAMIGHQTAQAWLGEDDPYSVIALSGLANVLADRGDHAAALAARARVLAATERTFGPAHAHTLTALNNLALSKETSGDLAGAGQAYSTAIERGAPVLGADHPGVLLARGNRAELWKDQGRLQQAGDELAAVVAGFERAAGRESVDRRHFLRLLAQVWRARGQPERTVKLLAGELPDPGSSSSSVDGAPMVLDLLVELAQAEFEAGRPQAARARWSQVLALAAAGSPQALRAEQALTGRSDR